MPKIELPNVSTDMMAFGGPIPQGDNYPTSGGVFKIDAPGAIETPCQMVSIATSKHDVAVFSRTDEMWSDAESKPDDYLNSKFPY